MTDETRRELIQKGLEVTDILDNILTSLNLYIAGDTTQYREGFNKELEKIERYHND